MALQTCHSVSGLVSQMTEGLPTQWLSTRSHAAPPGNTGNLREKQLVGISQVRRVDQLQIISLLRM